MLDVICFGASGGGRRLFPHITQKYNIIAFADNDPEKWGQKLFGIQIIPPDAIESLSYSAIVITSAPGMDSIIEQLLLMGVSREKIITSYIEFPLESRRVFLQSLSLLSKEWNEGGDIAEAGVFEGDFARYINLYFPKRTLHLFDTFEGFSKKDIEKEQSFSSAKIGDYSNVSVEMVLKKMPYPEKVVIHQGYFPDTTIDVQDTKFCFVNLDMDLYEPTRQGLHFFKERMSRNGVILVHDYFAENFRGVKAAVDEFLSESRDRYRILPVGDGISIMVLYRGM